MKEEAWNRCDICGKFFGFKDLESGAARIWQITPDTEWTYERWGNFARSITLLDPRRGHEPPPELLRRPRREKGEDDEMVYVFR